MFRISMQNYVQPLDIEWFVHKVWKDLKYSKVKSGIYIYCQYHTEGNALTSLNIF